MTTRLVRFHGAVLFNQGDCIHELASWRDVHRVLNDLQWDADLYLPSDLCDAVRNASSLAEVDRVLDATWYARQDTAYALLLPNSDKLVAILKRCSDRWSV